MSRDPRQDDSTKLRFLPVGLGVRGRNCLIIGGGSVGTRKALALARAGASVTVVSPTVSCELAERIEADGLKWIRDSFREEHLGDAFLVVAATDDEGLNKTVARCAAQRGALACNVSSAEHSQVIFGALLDADDVTIAVFSDGRDPARAARRRDEIANLLAQRGKQQPTP